MYADDTQLYLSIEPANVHDLVYSLECCLNDVKTWMVDNKLKLNDEKTEVLLCNPKKYNVDLDTIKIGNDTVELTDSVRNLGVYFDNDLSMNVHITNLSRCGVFVLVNVLCCNYSLSCRSYGPLVPVAKLI